MSEETPVKRWTAKRKSAVVIDNFKGKTTPVEVARQHDPETKGSHGRLKRSLYRSGYEWGVYRALRGRCSDGVQFFLLDTKIL